MGKLAANPYELYDYICENCGREETMEIIIPKEDDDVCCDCGGKLVLKSQIEQNF